MKKFRCHKSEFNHSYKMVFKRFDETDEVGGSSVVETAASVPEKQHLVMRADYTEHQPGEKPHMVVRAECAEVKGDSTPANVVAEVRSSFSDDRSKWTEADWARWENLVGPGYGPIT